MHLKSRSEKIVYFLPLFCWTLLLQTFFMNSVIGAEISPDKVRKSLVRILCTTQSPDYQTPWNSGRIGRGVGSGFIISNSRIMTNAHVVSNAKFIHVDKDSDSKKYPAEVLFIAHDCDLAILTVKNHDFFSDTEALLIGGIPQMHSNVTAFGYPIGGDRMSVTRGVVSRIEFRTYSHSGLDSHLTVQIDAAINPGNSGGPVIQNEKVIGVAFQGYSVAVAQNTGYMIPVPVINRFLKDIEDGKYDGYVELGIHYLNLQNPSYRQKLNFETHTGVGVVITEVVKAASAGGKLKLGDVLLKIDGHSISSDGHIILDGEYVQLEEVVERKFHGDKVSFLILRDGKQISVDVELKGAWPYAILANKYNVRPEFILFAGYLFQPLDRNFLNAYQSKNLDLNYHYSHFVKNELYLERPQIIVLSSILPDPINSYSREFVNSIIDEINGVKIKSLRDIANVFSKKSEYYVIKFLNSGKPLVIERSLVAAAQKRIKSQYNVIEDYFINDSI